MAGSGADLDFRQKLMMLGYDPDNPPAGLDGAYVEQLLDQLIPITSGNLGVRVANELSDPNSDSHAALSATYAGRDLTFAGQQAVAESSRVVRSSDDERAQLTPDGRTEAVFVTGQSDQTWGVVDCVASDDPTRLKRGTQSKRFTTSGAVVAQATLDPIFPAPAASPWTHDPAALSRLWFWVDDVTKLTGYLEIELYRGAGSTDRWRRLVPVEDLRTGWNLFTDATFRPNDFSEAMTSAAGWLNLHSLRFVWQTTGPTGINVGGMWFECPKKASLITVCDGAYKSFATLALPEFRSRGIPITWATQPARLGIDVGQKYEVVTAADIATYAAAGDDISFHTYDGGGTSTMTPSEIRDDALRCLAASQEGEWGPGRLFRAAWMQNNAPEHAASQPYFAAYATPNERDSVIESWPPIDRYDIGRLGLHFYAESVMDDVFTLLEKTRGLMVGYTHGIDAAGNGDMTPTQLAYFLSKVDAAMAAGWLEGVTFTQLVERGGGVIRA